MNSSKLHEYAGTEGYSKSADDTHGFIWLSLQEEHPIETSNLFQFRIYFPREPSLTCPAFGFIGCH